MSLSNKAIDRMARAEVRFVEVILKGGFILNKLGRASFLMNLMI